VSQTVPHPGAVARSPEQEYHAQRASCARNHRPPVYGLNDSAILVTGLHLRGSRCVAVEPAKSCEAPAPPNAGQTHGASLDDGNAIHSSHFALQPT
jgi:hypothetical protein